MFELYKIRQSIKDYECLFYEEPEVLKSDILSYSKDIESLLSFVDMYINEYSDRLVIWCDANVAVWSIENPSLWMKFRIFFWQKIIDYQLNRISYLLSKAKIYQSILLGFQKRLNSIHLICNV